ncbi:hypothetical protein [Brevibacterium atlanticum]|uniref:hypothetical protein n=1 Tax=Brevibacterium atlanticum TaxID=2697563 RepID=UPI001421D856|nr:hypothetical protein [Brevibacterium atlanticum]
MTAQGPSRLKWIAAIIIVGVMAVGAALLSANRFDAARAERIAAEESDEIVVDSIYSDRIEGQYDPDYDRTRYQDIARSFADDPIHIDEYRAFDVDDASLDAVRETVDDLDVPIYVAILSDSDLDDADGETDLLAARIARELPDEAATVLVVGEVSEGIGDRGAVRRLTDMPETDADDDASETALRYAQALTAVDVEDPAESYSRTIDDDGQPVIVNEDTARDPRELAYPIGGAVTGAIFGVIIGGGLGVGGVLVIRQLRKRNGHR